MMLLKVSSNNSVAFQGNFFANIGSICVFAIFGTIISALTVGGGVYLLGKVKISIEPILLIVIRLFL